MPAGVRHADLRVAARRACSPSGRPTAEGDRPADVVNEIVRVPPDGSRGAGLRPRLRVRPAAGARTASTLSWLQWDHPDMPWDAAQLVVRAADGTEHVLAGGPGRVRRPAGRGARTWRCGSSATAPTSGRCTASGRTRRPSSSSTSAATSPARSGCSGRAGSRCSPTAGSRSPTAATAPTGSPSSRPTGACASSTCPFSVFRDLTAQGTSVVCVAGGPAQRAGGPAGRRRRRRAGDPPPGPRPRPGPGLVLPAGARDLPDRGRAAPASARRTRWSTRRPTPSVARRGRRAAAADGRSCTAARPSAAVPVLNLDVQYWTSRGFCVADVDYRGSTGYGRRYRDALQGRWGIARPRRRRRLRPATWPTAAGWTRPGWRSAAARPAATRRWPRSRMRPGVFTAGASHYGVADLGALAAETHKFESRYLDGLVAPWPDGRRRLRRALTDQPRRRARHPAGGVPGRRGRASCRRTRPRRSSPRCGRRACRTPTCCSPASSTASGKAENIRAALDGELSFYAQVWGFDLPADEGIPPIEVRPQLTTASRSSRRDPAATAVRPRGRWG